MTLPTEQATDGESSRSATCAERESQPSSFRPCDESASESVSTASSERRDKMPASGLTGIYPVTSEAKAILQAAMQIEPDPVQAACWYQQTCMAELDGLTSAQLVASGRAQDVLMFLESIRQGMRD